MRTSLMPAASAPSFLASLREYFHQRRTYVRRRRVGRSHAMRHHASASRFTLELLEDRVLLSATPTELVAPEIAPTQQSAEQAIVSPQDVSLELAAAPTAAGQLVISEIMVNGASEWFELYNPTSTVWDLQGLTIRDNNINPDQHTIASPVPIQPGGFAVLGNNGTTTTNGGVTLNYVYSNFVLNDTADAVRIFNGATLIDEVSYSSSSGWPVQRPGQSMVLNPTRFDSVNNDIASNWSYATTHIGGPTTDFGNPGSGAPTPVITINNVTVTEGHVGTTNAVFTVSLSQPVPQVVTVNYATANGSGSTSATAGSDYVATSGTVTFLVGETAKQITVSVNGDLVVEPSENYFVNLSGAVNATLGDSGSQGQGTILDDDTLAPGNLIITEIMADPNAVPDSAGEWFELYNPATRAWDLQGLTFKDDGTDQFTVLSPLTIQPNSFLVFGNNGNPAQNGGVTVNYVYPSTFSLDNTSDVIELKLNAAVSIDRVAYSSAGSVPFPLVPGRSIILNPTAFNAVSNDQGSNWSAATTPLTGGDFGNPGSGTLPVFSINDVTVQEGDSGTAQATFTVTLPGGPVSQPTSVNYATANGTALAGSDYVGTSGTLTFAAGETSKPVIVLVKGDTAIEPSETFQVVLSSPVNAVLGDAVGQGTIVDPAERVFIVNSTGDETDTNPGDGVALTTLGTTTLRAAIQEANAFGGTDRIWFGIGTGPQTITPLTALPVITETILIDGSTQPGFSSSPLIEISFVGSSEDVNGLQILSDSVDLAKDSIVRSLIINGFTGSGIEIDNASGIVIQGNYIGTNSLGTAGMGNGKDGVLIVNGQNNLIGGTSAQQRNVISGNAGDGINVTGLNAASNVIQGNYVGTDVTGTIAIANIGNGIALNQGARANTVGGTAAGSGNVISGNDASGIVLDGQLINLSLDLAPAAAGSNPTGMTVFNNALYFSATDGFSGQELWRYDGAGGSLIKDIAAGSNGSAPSLFTLFDGSMFFIANDGTGVGLWRTDGTTAGTQRKISNFAPRNMAAFGGALYLNVDSGGFELWKYDGVSASATAVKNINAGGDANPTEFTTYNNLLYFAADDGTANGGRDLWRTDGTAAGTVRVADINPTGSSNPSDFEVFDGKLYFRATDGVHGLELWSYDGTTAAMVSDLAPGTANSSPQELTVFDNALTFVTDTGANAYKLWKYDGSTVNLVTTFNVQRLHGLTVFNSQLYLDAVGNSVTALWRYDGTTLSQVGEMHPVGFGSFTTFNNAMYFTATDALHGAELWSFGQTASIRSDDIVAGAPSSLPSHLTPFNNAMYFSVGTGTAIDGLWRSFGSISQAAKVNGVTPRDMGAYNGNLYLNELDASGVELWKYDGIAAAPVAVKNINSGGDANPTDFMVYNNYLYFAADDGIAGRELWRTDGTAAGTVRVADINPTGSSNPSALQVFNGKLYFSATDGIHGAELWSYDGTSATLLADVSPGSFGSSPTGLTVFNNALYFVAGAGFGAGIWVYKYDGTAISQLPNLQKPRDLEVFNGALYFWALATDGQRGLWRDDGTTAILVAPDLDLTNLIVLNNALYFSTNGDDGAGKELWRYDGVGPTRVTDVNPGAGDFDPQGFAVLGSTLFFTGDNGLTGRELYWLEGGNDRKCHLGQQNRNQCQRHGSRREPRRRHLDHRGSWECRRWGVGCCGKCDFRKFAQRYPAQRVSGNRKRHPRKFGRYRCSGQR
jgi:CSLREA domain-containing protein